MKRPLSDVKKTTSTIIAALLTGTSNAFVGGTPVIDLSATANQVKGYATQLRQYGQMYFQLQQRIRMVQIQKQNLERLTKEDWDSLGTVLCQTRNIMNKASGISYDIGNVSRKFKDTYKDFEGYNNDLENAANENERNKAYFDRYRQIVETNRNAFNGTLQQLELRYQDLESKDTFIAKLKQNLQSSSGDLQAVQATNDPSTYQIDGIGKLRSIVMDQSSMLTNYLASQNNKQILEQVKMGELFQGDKNNNFYQSDSDAFEWEQNDVRIFCFYIKSRRKTIKHFILSGSIGSGALAFLAGCDDEAGTSDYYETHLDEAKARAAECKKIEKMNETQQRDCSNANEAVLFQKDKSNKFYQSSPEAFEWK